jgi:DNA polymerase-1
MIILSPAGNINDLRSALRRFDVSKPIIIDTETVSFNPKEIAVKAYHGHRVGAIMIGQSGVEPIGFLIRNNYDKSRCLPIGGAVAVMREWALAVTTIVGHNLKFDLRMLMQDGIEFKNAKTHCTIVASRVVNNDLMSYSLENVCIQFNLTHKKKADKVKEFLAKLDSKDYGDCDPEILLEYGIDDIHATVELYHYCLNNMPPEAVPVFDNDSQLLKHLFYCEHRGIKINRDFLKKKRIKLLVQMMKIGKELEELVGHGFNPNSSTHLDNFFKKNGISPVNYTEKGAASWGAKEIEQVSQLLDPKSFVASVCRKIMEYKEMGVAESTFCEGWMEHCDSKGYIHPDFRVAGTRTGRLSSGEPNVQNPPEWIMNAWEIRPGYVGIKFDLAQIEYRLFTHYSKEEWLLDAYEKNPETDLHQIVADLLGFPRKPVKSINFGIIYGMGEAKLTRTIAAGIMEFDSPKLRTQLQGYVDQFTNPIPDEGTIPQKSIEAAAKAILKDYHKRIPSIKAIIKDIKNAIYAKGYIRNYFGRRYYMSVDKAYIGLNYLVQGSAADLFKTMVNRILDANPRAEMIDNIHDALLCEVPVEFAQAYYDSLKPIISNNKFRVPILFDCEVAIGNWGNITKFKGGDILHTALSLVGGGKAKV